MSPKMYALIDQNSFHLNITPTTTTPSYPIKFNLDGVNVPYMREEKSTIVAKFVLKKNYGSHPLMSITVNDFLKVLLVKCITMKCDSTN